MRRTAVALAALLTAACGTTSSPAAETPSSASASAVPTVPGIEAEIVRLRTDEAIGGQVQVRLTDTGDTPFTVTSVALRSPGFAPEPPTSITAEYAPGRVIDLPVPYGGAVCDAPPVPAVAEVTVGRPNGAVEQLEVPAAGEVLKLIHAEECAVLGVTAVVGIAITDLHEEGDTLVGALTLTRRKGTEPVVASRLERSVLLQANAPGLPLELGGDEQVASAAVTFVPANCEPHVLSETKKPFVFPLSVTVGSGDEVPVDLPIEEPVRDQLTALVQRVCVPA
ncbi:hypothetical protein [Blastococcus sp. CT_GayMR16]|uniref:hypothetical protein n=1 Tax=Blastococcus sp. CT_GayMR16 TaxID=2559607 RepID=UPI001073B73D|nr:hypothetical protein [Blastococcus sp. CT_GayMR16]TFV86474.1 hypothetical protein E4P38_17170 [Blastococcus sp. CT_GayMR16]